MIMLVTFVPQTPPPAPAFDLDDRFHETGSHGTCG
jgi:hypothetical protein